jgi:hypothetical protein
LYINHNPPNPAKPSDETPETPTWFILGQIDAGPEWDNGELYFHTKDMICTEDVAWPQSLQDGKFYKGSERRSTGPPSKNWVNVSSENVLVLAIFNRNRGLNTKGFLMDNTLKKVHAVLKANEKKPYIAAFLAQDDAKRIKLPRPLKTAKRSKKPKRQKTA